MKNFKEKISKIKKDNFWKTLFTNSFWAFLGDGMASVINLVITIVLIWLIGNYDYGSLVLAQSYMQIMDVLLNIQSWKSVIQYGQKALVKKDTQKLCGYVKIGCFLDVSTAILGGVASFFLAGLIGKIFGWDNTLIWCARIFSLTIFLHFSGTPTAILRITNKFNLVAIQKVVAAIFKLGCLGFIFFWKKSISLLNAVIIYTITDALGNLLLVLLAFFVFFKKYGFKNLIKAKIPKDYKEFTKYTLWGTLSEIVDIPINYFDVFIISFLSKELVAVFKVFKQIVAILSKVTTPIYQAIMPQFSELSAKGLKQRGFEVVLKIRKTILAIGIPFTILVSITSPFWLKIIYGDLYAQNWYILGLYLLVQTLALSYTTVHPYFISLGKTKESAIYVLIANIVYVILAISFVKSGGMIALVICYFIQAFIVIYLKVKNIKKSLKQKKLKECLKICKIV